MRGLINREPLDGPDPGRRAIGDADHAQDAARRRVEDGDGQMRPPIASDDDDALGSRVEGHHAPCGAVPQDDAGPTVEQAHAPSILHEDMPRARRHEHGGLGRGCPQRHAAEGCPRRGIEHGHAPGGPAPTEHEGTVRRGIDRDRDRMGVEGDRAQERAARRVQHTQAVCRQARLGDEHAPATLIARHRATRNGDRARDAVPRGIQDAHRAHTEAVAVAHEDAIRSCVYGEGLG